MLEYKYMDLIYLNYDMYMMNAMQVTHKCMCIVRLVAAYPWKAEDLISPVTGRYRVRFTLEDATGRIRAYLCAEDGVYLLLSISLLI